MSSAGKISANRANARASTGPKTAQGRARSARNAHRHGLSLPVLADPALSEEVEILAREIAGAGAGSQIQELARRIAEAQIDLRRVRYARHEIISRALGDLSYDSHSNEKKRSALAMRMLAAMDRYERRALVRRKFAIRAFDEARARTASALGKCAGT